MNVTENNTIGTTFLTRESEEKNQPFTVAPLDTEEDEKKPVDIVSDSSYRDDFESSIADSES